MSRPSSPPIVVRGYWIAAAFTIIAFIAFGPSLRAPFDFDDLPAIVHNVSIRRLWPLTIPLDPPALGTAASGRPVVNFSFALNNAAAESPTATLGYHVVEILLHVATALLVFATVRVTIRRGRIAEQWRDAAERIGIVAAAIWLVHPIQTEAVDYVSQRTELLVSLFYMTTLYCAIRAWETSAARWSVLAVVACALGMGSKEVMLTAPIAVVLYDRAFLFESWRAAWSARSRRWLYIALLVTSGLSIFLVAHGGRDGTVGFGLGMTWYQYFYSQCWAIAHYLRLVLWPNALTYDYGQTPIRDLSGVPGAIGLSLLGIATLVAWRRSNLRWLAFLGSWFFLLLAPSSSVVPIRTEIAAERRIYLALAAVFVLVAIGFERLRRIQERRATALYAGGALLYVAMIAASFQRSRLYQNPELLWRDTAIKQPNNARAWNGVAAAQLRREPTNLAEPDSFLVRALAADSGFVQAWLNRAVIAIHSDRFADAESFLRRGIAAEPGDSALNEQLGAVLTARGKPELAIPYLQRVARVFPNAKSLTRLGTAYLTSGHLDSAIVAFRRATELDSAYVDALNYLGAALVESDRGSEAIPYLLRSIRQDSGTGFSLALLCLAYGESHQPDLAAQAAASAIARDPRNATAYLFSGRGLQAAGRLVDAEKYLAAALRLDPDDPQSLTRLGMVEASLGKIADGRHLVRRALEIAPTYGLAIQAERTLEALR